MLLPRTVVDLASQVDLVRRRAHGVIEVADRRFVCLRLRPWPKLVSLPEQRLWGGWIHSRRKGDRCLLYYNQPARMPNFLAITYAVSHADTTLATIRGALVVLDEIARLKRIDALVCDVANPRISHRLLVRWGWEAHCASRWHRHYIKRFYGCYPSPTGPDTEAQPSTADVSPASMPALMAR